MWIRRSLFACIVGVSLHATPLFDNLLSPSGLGIAVQSDQTPYQGFSTDAHLYQLTSVSFGFYYDGGLGSMTAYLYDDNAGSPGSLLATLGTIQDSLLTCCGVFQTIEVDPASPIFLQPATTYFVLLQGSTPKAAGADALWVTAPGATGIGVTGQPTIPGYESTPLTMDVEAAIVSPEPGTWILLGAGLILVKCLGALHDFQQRFRR